MLCMLFNESRVFHYHYDSLLLLQSDSCVVLHILQMLCFQLQFSEPEIMRHLICC